MCYYDRGSFNHTMIKMLFKTKFDAMIKMLINIKVLQIFVRNAPRLTFHAIFSVFVNHIYLELT